MTTTVEGVWDAYDTCAIPGCNAEAALICLTGDDYWFQMTCGEGHSYTLNPDTGEWE